MHAVSLTFLCNDNSSPYRIIDELENASAPKSAETHASTFCAFATLTFDLLTPKINRFQGLMV